MLLGVNKSLLALTVVTGTLLTGCNEASPDQKSTNPTQNIVKPDAPVGPIVNDDLDQFGWSWSHNLSDKQFYEIKIPNQPWSTVNGNPHQLVIDGIYAAGDIQIRVKADSSKNRTASDVLVNPIIYTANSLVKRPKSPTNPVQNDSLNTFDWEFVSGFSTANEYEYSLTGGVSWNTVTNKPLLVGDVDIDVGHVQVRVKENAADGTAAGSVLISTQAFTAGVLVVISAPTAPVIVNNNIGNTNYPQEIKTNGFSWEWVTNGNTGVDYDEPEYYEFTNDGGMTWQAVTSRPQHVGPKAYAKNKVGVRVKKNAIANQVNPAGQTLFATGASADFYVTRVVSMNTWNQAQELTSAGNWSKAKSSKGAEGCYIEYDINGENPQFWAYAGTNDNADKVLELLSTEFCGMQNWQLLTTTEMKVKTLVDSSYITGTLNHYLVTSDSYYKHWASETVNGIEALKAISAGQEVNAAYSTRVILKWELPDTAKILTETTSTNTALKALVSSQNSNWQTTSVDLINVINNISALVDQPLTPLLSDVTTAEANSKTAFDSLTLALTEYQNKIDVLTLYSTMLESDSSVDKALKATINNNIASIKLDFINLTSLHTSFQSALTVTPALTALIKLTDQKTTANSVRDTLLAANDGADIHGRSLDLFAAAALINDFIKANVSLVADLNSATSELPVTSNTALISALDKLLIMFNNLPTAVDSEALTAHAVKGLERASSGGYSVAAADAVIGTHFAKLDINGDYLPSATTYARGWRCVMDNRDLVRKRMWTLLKDGLPNGADDLAFDASSAGIASVMGTGGLIESTTAAQLCGRSDWALPSSSQLTSLETGTIDGTATIDVDVFPHHLAFDAKYDTNDWSSSAKPSTRFWYWKNEERNSSEQRTYHFATDHKSSTTGSESKEGDEDKVVMGRLVSEIKLIYQLLDSAGDITADTDAAVCAYQPESKVTWQLFDNADLETRSKDYGNTNADVGTVLAEAVQRNSEKLCNKSNWRVPSLAELKTLSPVNHEVFTYSNVEKYGKELCYVSADPARYSRQKCYYTGSEKSDGVDKKPYNSNSYIYRLITSD
ncbi:hypothetical protein [Moritella sp. Urea-trap-13]|uniref:hypothetical protein n=1 Tax=Moritella sp. Urea-trap-13 TaxID=2058327 RepID=UPI000C33427D|nr:hypothetical protein [Moritella sp. Urea-trap-13]PKH05933.1 hypothetical protein CXF93_08300 [Moritella sp. Urea-trap-13]